MLLFSHWVVSDSLRPHGQQHTRLPCPSPSLGACSNSLPWSRWCHPSISSFVIPLPSCLLSFPASGSFLMSQFFTSGGQSIGASSSASVFTKTIQDWFPWGCASWILAVLGMLKNLLQHHSSKPSILWCSASFMVQLSHPYLTTWKAKTKMEFCWQSYLLFLIFCLDWS